jgi:hypothetical protein
MKVAIIQSLRTAEDCVLKAMKTLDKSSVSHPDLRTALDTCKVSIWKAFDLAERLPTFAGRPREITCAPLLAKGGCGSLAAMHRMDSLRIRDDDGRIFTVCLDCGEREYEL